MKDPATESTGLRAYKVKRNFRQTAEPKPRRAKRHASGLLFVIQKHAPHGCITIFASKWTEC